MTLPRQATQLPGLATLLTSLCLLALPATAGDFPMADKVVVEKENRKLHLLRNGEIFRTFDVALGVAPIGTKEREGDQKTPDVNARRNGDDPGGAIMIHGQPNAPTYSTAYYRQEDWGCIAVSNSDMIDIWLMTANDVPIEILP
jgi:murein L,D-transpeptidase YafK